MRLRWQARLLGPVTAPLVILDGKARRHGGLAIVNAVSGTGRYLGAVLTPAKSSEVPAVRQLACLPVAPSPVGFPGAHLAARLETRVRHKANGKAKAHWTCKVVYLLSSHPLGKLPAAGLLRRKRGYWVIESRRHPCLDVTIQEDLSRVRTPNSALALALIRRVVLSLANAAVDRGHARRPKNKGYTQGQHQEFSAALPFRPRRPRAPAGAHFRESPERAGLNNWKMSGV